MAPMMVTTSATTAAKIGRSMKKRLILMGVAVPKRGAGRRPPSFLRLHDRLGGHGRCRRRLLAPGCDLAARARTLQPPDDHPLLRRDAFAHYAHALVERAELDVAAGHGAVVADNVDELVG